MKKFLGIMVLGLSFVFANLNDAESAQRDSIILLCPQSGGSWFLEKTNERKLSKLSNRRKNWCLHKVHQSWDKPFYLKLLGRLKGQTAGKMTNNQLSKLRTEFDFSKIWSAKKRAEASAKKKAEAKKTETVAEKTENNKKYLDIVFCKTNEKVKISGKEWGTTKTVLGHIYPIRSGGHCQKNGNFYSIKGLKGYAEFLKFYKAKGIKPVMCYEIDRHVIKVENAHDTSWCKGLYYNLKSILVDSKGFYLEGEGSTEIAEKPETDKQELTQTQQVAKKTSTQTEEKTKKQTTVTSETSSSDNNYRELIKKFGSECESSWSNFFTGHKVGTLEFDQCLAEKQNEQIKFAKIEAEKLKTEKEIYLSLSPEEKRAYTCTNTFGFRKGSDKFRDCIFKIYATELELAKLEVEKQLAEAQLETAKAHREAAEARVLAAKAQGELQKAQIQAVEAQAAATRQQAAASKAQAAATNQQSSISLMMQGLQMLQPTQTQTQSSFNTTCTWMGKFMNCW